jgi:hypothetical protein
LPGEGHGRSRGAADSLPRLKGWSFAPLLIGRRKTFPNGVSAGLSVLEWHDHKAIDEFGDLIRSCSTYL